jgi:hypothetical protein
MSALGRGCVKTSTANEHVNRSSPEAPVLRAARAFSSMRGVSRERSCCALEARHRFYTASVRSAGQRTYEITVKDGLGELKEGPLPETVSSTGNSRNGRISDVRRERSNVMFAGEVVQCFEEVAVIPARGSSPGQASVDNKPSVRAAWARRQCVRRGITCLIRPRRPPA